MKYNWYNLVNSLKTTLPVDSGELTVDPVTYNKIVSEIRWYNLPSKIQELLDLINEVSVVLDLQATWYNLPYKAEQIYDNFN